MLLRIIYYLSLIFTTSIFIWDLFFNKTGAKYFINRVEAMIPYMTSLVLFIFYISGILYCCYMCLLVMLLPSLALVFLGLYLGYRITKKNYKFSGAELVRLNLQITLVLYVISALAFFYDNYKYAIIYINLNFDLIFFVEAISTILVLVVVLKKLEEYYMPLKIKSTIERDIIVLIVIIVPVLEEVLYRLTFYLCYGFTINGLFLSILGFIVVHLSKLIGSKTDTRLKALALCSMVILSLINYIALYFVSNIFIPILIHAVYNALTIKVLY